MHFLVTGASGFLGRPLCLQLLELRHVVTAVSRSGTNYVGAHNVQVNDFSDQDQLCHLMEGVDVVVHLAARAHILQDSAIDPKAEFSSSNVAVTKAVVTCAKYSGVKRIVYLSTIGVNGMSTRGHPFVESDQPKPIDEYARSKLEAERVIELLLHNAATEYVVLRPPLVYGPNCRANFLKMLHFIKHAPLLPFGAYKTHRSFIFLGNMIDAIINASLAEGVNGKVFLVSDNETITVGQLFKELTRYLGQSERKVVSVPTVLLKIIATIAGKQDALTKLTRELQDRKSVV